MATNSRGADAHSSAYSSSRQGRPAKVREDSPSPQRFGRTHAYHPAGNRKAPLQATLPEVDSPETSQENLSAPSNARDQQTKPQPRKAQIGQNDKEPLGAGQQSKARQQSLQSSSPERRVPQRNEQPGYQRACRGCGRYGCRGCTMRPAEDNRAQMEGESSIDYENRSSKWQTLDCMFCHYSHVEGLGKTQYRAGVVCIYIGFGLLFLDLIWIIAAVFNPYAAIYRFLAVLQGGCAIGFLLVGEFYRQHAMRKCKGLGHGKSPVKRASLYLCRCSENMMVVDGAPKQKVEMVDSSTCVRTVKRHKKRASPSGVELEVPSMSQTRLTPLRESESASEYSQVASQLDDPEDSDQKEVEAIKYMKKKGKQELDKGRVVYGIRRGSTPERDDRDSRADATQISPVAKLHADATQTDLAPGNTAARDGESDDQRSQPGKDSDIWYDDPGDGYPCANWPVDISSNSTSRENLRNPPATQSNPEGRAVPPPHLDPATAARIAADSQHDSLQSKRNQRAPGVPAPVSCPQFCGPSQSDLQMSKAPGPSKQPPPNASEEDTTEATNSSVVGAVFTPTDSLTTGIYVTGHKTYGLQTRI